MINNNKGTVIWLTGLPCSGKTTLSKEIEKYFQDKNLPIQRLDGDVVRTTISNDLGFSKRDRDENIRRVSYIAKMLADNGISVVVAFVSPYEKMRSFAREICPNFVGVYVKCSLEECKRRDVKGMYAKAERGEIEDFTGINDPYEKPSRAEVVIDTEKGNIKNSLKKLKKLLGQSIKD